MSNTSETGYQVLARKYRPTRFADLIGQDAMVRTLKNAFDADRIAQAFILTGIRGTGKTTTARIIAKGMNCIGKDGNGGPTTEPCGICEPCVAITEGRHVDVLEMDAASRTGVADIREIIEGVAYRAASARYKIYIIDEVHMLSKSAFNALLKTLEEPPEHVKFIFATTEIRQVPVTVLSRCQRFDLRRIEPEVMIDHLKSISEREGAAVAEDAMALITRAAEGSVRDAMSLLDQAIAHGAGETTADHVRSMLGLADRGRILDLFEQIVSGDVSAALSELSSQYADGADPMAVLRDLAEVTHWLSVVKITPEAQNDPTIGPDERSRGGSLAQALPMRVLTRLWQMLLKSLEEVSLAPNSMMAAEMAVIRLTHVAELPTPEELVRKLTSDTGTLPPDGGQRKKSSSPSTKPAEPATPAPAQVASAATGGSPQVTALAPQTEHALDHYPTFQNVIALIRANRDQMLLYEVERYVRLVAYSPGRIEFQPTEDAPPDLAAKIGQALQRWTGARWAISVVAEGGAETIYERDHRAELEAIEHASEHPLVKSILAAFPGSAVSSVRTPEQISSAANVEALPEVEEEWDPFEEE